MRNPNRIKRFCDRLYAAWIRHPDLRFGQIVENVKQELHMYDIFYIEDEPLIRAIENSLRSKSDETD